MSNNDAEAFFFLLRSVRYGYLMASPGRKVNTVEWGRDVCMYNSKVTEGKEGGVSTVI